MRTSSWIIKHSAILNRSPASSLAHILSIPDLLLSLMLDTSGGASHSSSGAGHDEDGGAGGTTAVGDSTSSLLHEGCFVQVVAIWEKEMAATICIFHLQLSDLAKHPMLWIMPLVVVLLVAVRPLRYSVLYAARFTSGQVWYGIDEQIRLFPVPSLFKCQNGSTF